MVGSFYPDNVKVEHYKTSWSTLGDFPYASSFIGHYSTVTIDGEVYIFGELNLNTFPFFVEFSSEKNNLDQNIIIFI